MPHPYKILVIQTAFIGDVILITPLLAALKRHITKCQVTVLVTPAAAEVLQNNPWVDQIIRYDKRASQKGLFGFLRLTQLLRSNQYDTILAPHRSWRTALLALCTGASRRIGFDANRGACCYTHRQPYRQQHEIERNLSLLAALDINVRSQRPEIFPDEQDCQLVDQLTAGVNSQPGWMALAPGSVWPTKRWPEEHYRALTDLLLHDGFSVFLIGGDKDRDLCHRIVRGAGPQVINTCGRLSLRASAELLRRCRGLVTNDSAPLHLASTMNTPTLALFGPTIPAFGFAPYAERSFCMQRTLDCRPCSTHGSVRCPIGTHACMIDISVASVYHKLIELTA